MDYRSIVTRLKRYSFEEKMKIAQEFSQMTMEATGTVSAQRLKTMAGPWELETFVMLSIVAQEWASGDFHGENRREFIRIIQNIRDFEHPRLMKAEGTEFLESFMIATSAIQFDIQEFIFYKLFRYHYIFSFENDRINMKEMFMEKFGCEFWDFAVFSITLNTLFCMKMPWPTRVTNYLQDKYQNVFKCLTITRERYVQELRSITADVNDYQYCLRPSYTYLIITEHGKSFIPLPHLLLRSSTTSLLYRMTEKNNALQELIGKEVLEPYLYFIVHGSKIFQEVIPEQEYIKGGKGCKTIDVMARRDETYVFFDSKSFSPKRDLRIFDDAAKAKDTERLAEGVEQMYAHVLRKFPIEYNFFEYKAPVDHEKAYGLVVVKEKPYITQENIYRVAAERLKINPDSPEYQWLCTHIGVVCIYDIERFCFTGSDIVSAVQTNAESGKINDHWLSQSLNQTELIVPEVYDFKKKLVNSVRSIEPLILPCGTA